MNLKENKLFQELLNNKDIYYLYNSSYDIYGIDVEPKSIIAVCKKDFKLPNDILNDDNFMILDNGIICYDHLNLQLFEIGEWFDKVLESDIICWECACLNKKYVYKDYVKLMLSADPVLIRNYYNTYTYQFFTILDNYSWEDDDLTIRQLFFEYIKIIVFSNQILENHKIINFKEMIPIYQKLFNPEITTYDDFSDVYASIIVEHAKRLHKYTDEQFQNSKIAKIKQ